MTSKADVVDLPLLDDFNVGPGDERLRPAACL